MASREEMLAAIKRKRLLEQVKAKRASSSVAETPEQGQDIPSFFARPMAVVEGATLGLGDEVAALGGATYEKLKQAVTGKGDKTWKEAFNEKYAPIERLRNQFQEDRPKEALALNVAGSLATGPVGGTKSVATPFLKRALKSVAGGAIEGAIAGAGTANAGERLKGAGIGAGFGAATGGVLTGLGGLANAIAKRRIAENLVQADGSQKPLHLMAEPGESKVVDFYRGGVGASFGGGGALKKQELPFLHAADQAVDAAQVQQSQLAQQADAVKTGYENRKLQNALAAQAKEQQTAAQGKQLVRSVRDLTESQVARASDGLERKALDEALPVDAPLEQRQALLKLDPQTAAKQLDAWWTENGFNMVKGRDFEWTGTLQTNLDKLVEGDPALALKLGDIWARIPGMTNRMQAAAMKNVKPGTAMTSEQMGQAVRESLPQITHINGDALMAMRNFFARASNSTSSRFDKGALRQVANVFDEEIRTGLGKGTAAESAFNDHISRWGIKSTYEKAVAAAESQGGRFTPKQWQQAGGKGKKAAFGEKPLQKEAEAIIRTEKDSKKLVGKVKEDTAAKTQATKQAEQRAQKQEALRLAREAAKERQRLKKIGKEGLEKAREAAAGLHKRALTSHSIWEKAYKTAALGGGPSVLMGGAVPGAALALPIGAGISRVLASKPVQRFAAGQTEFQRALARDLRISEKEREILARAMRRSAAQQAAQE